MPDTDELNVEAAKLLERMTLVPPREPGDKLRPADEARILELHAAGHSQTAIAEAIGCHQSTVSRTLAEYDDSRPLARKYLESRAFEMTQRLVTDATPEVILKVLGKLDVVREEAAGGGTNILIAMGQPGQPLEPPSLTIEAVGRVDRDRPVPSSAAVSVSGRALPVVLDREPL